MVTVTSPEIVRYGEHSSQYAECWLPRVERVRAVVVLIHGGWWRARHSLRLMDSLCADLVGRGLGVWNLEFRRIDGDDGGWPQTVGDVADAIVALRRAGMAGRDIPLVAVGHSAGGHLALQAAAQGLVDAVVGLAPITDLVACYEEGLGEAAVGLFMGASPEHAPLEYRAASPVCRVPIGRPQLIVHGDADVRVSVEHSRGYVSAAESAGDDVELLELAGVDHFQVIDPDEAGWQQVIGWLEGYLDDRHCGNQTEYALE
ncbi:alpha/beta fold hydrolase [Nocardia sp. R6R-6]|uniref:alpha/beta fold hydrolase n=1 Tax=Nocardia sp. R6R-6 TaxID=3459303 RepID=UPI00403D6244